MNDPIRKSVEISSDDENVDLSEFTKTDVGIGATISFSDDLENFEELLNYFPIPIGETVLYAAEGGENALGALASGADRVLAFCENPRQTEFCKLKTELARQLSWDEALVLSGVLHDSPKRRKQILESLELPPELDFFRFGPTFDQIARDGVLELGKTASLSRRFRKSFSGLVSKDVIQKILQEEEARERDLIWREHFDREDIGSYLGVVALEIMKDPDFFPYDLSRKIPNLLAQKYIRDLLYHFLVLQSPTQNYVLHRLFLGTYLTSNKLPPNLQMASFEKLKKKINGILWTTQSLEEVLETLHPESIGAANLGHKMDWLDARGFSEAWKHLDRAVKLNGKVFLRTFLLNKRIPKLLGWKLERAWGFAHGGETEFLPRMEIWVKSEI